MKNIVLAALGLLIGFAAGLAYAWLISPVEYVDANPALLRADFKDQYRIIIADSYASTRDLARANARLNLLGDLDPLGALRAQAQRMVGGSEPKEFINLLVQLAEDLQAGVVSVPATSTLPPTVTPVFETLTPESTASALETSTIFPDFAVTQTAMPEFIQTPFALPAFTLTPRPTFTPVSDTSAPFVLIGQETVCDPNLQPGLLQFTLVDSKRRQMGGVEIIVTSIEGDTRLFTGFKPEVGNGYADFVMKENVSYSARVASGGSFLTNLIAPTCSDSNGVSYLGGISLAFQQR